MSVKVIGEYTVKTRLTSAEMQKLIELCKEYGLEKVKKVSEELMRQNKKVTVKELERLLKSKS